MPRNAVQPLDKFFNVMSLVAIVGRPNVGKSTLFNRLVGQRQAIVDSTAGTTRDRHYGKTDWNGKEFSVMTRAVIRSIRTIFSKTTSAGR